MTELPDDLKQAARLLTAWFADETNRNTPYPEWANESDELEKLYLQISRWRTHQGYLAWEALTDEEKEQVETLRKELDNEILEDLRHAT